MPKILLSPGYGAGWVTWNYGDGTAETYFMLTHPGLIRAIEDGVPLGTPGGIGDPDPSTPLGRFVADFKARFPDSDAPHLGGARDLMVVEVPAGVAFKIGEYDGFESIEGLDQNDWFVLTDDTIEGTATEIIGYPVIESGD